MASLSAASSVADITLPMEQHAHAQTDGVEHLMRAATESLNVCDRIRTLSGSRAAQAPEVREQLRDLSLTLATLDVRAPPAPQGERAVDARADEGGSAEFCRSVRSGHVSRRPHTRVPRAPSSPRRAARAVLLHRRHAPGGGLPAAVEGNRA